MKTNVVEVDLNWPEEVSPLQLRKWLLQRLCSKGVLLRWAITAVEASSDKSAFRKVTVEAVYITGEG